MANIEIKCSFCKKRFLRPKGRFNEAKKFNWNQYCSQKCQNRIKITRIKRVCANPGCGKKVFRLLNQFKKSKSGRVFCSTSCAAIVNNSPRRKIKTCPVCSKKFLGFQKYCSRACYANFLKAKPRVIKVSKLEIIIAIQNFYKKNGRIPFKMEFAHYNAARRRFGSWNKAVLAAGLEPNPVKFAKKYFAKDGHKCNSLAEKIIDDWLFEREIKHDREIAYPGNKSLTADFLVKNHLIEFLGLAGVLKRYDQLIKKKRSLCKKHNLSLIEIYPKDLFPVNHLEKIIKIKR